MDLHRRKNKEIALSEEKPAKIELRNTMPDAKDADDDNENEKLNNLSPIPGVRGAVTNMKSRVLRVV